MKSVEVYFIVRTDVGLVAIGGDKGQRGGYASGEAES